MPIICCPHCGLPHSIPERRPPAAKATFNCRRCQRLFPLDQATANLPPTGRQLTEISHLLASSWQLFCQRGWGLLAIYLLTSLTLFAPLALAIFFLPTLAQQGSLLFWSSIVACAGFGLLGGAWLTGSMVSYTCFPKLGIPSAIKQGQRQLWQYATLLLLLALLITGGSLLLLVPGIIFTVWFFFCHYILAEEGISGLKALERSRQLVQGHWWSVFGRFLLLLLIALVITSLTARIPAVGAPLNFIFTLLLTPFSLIYYHQIYQDLKRCQPSPPTSQSPPVLTSVTALLGWMVVPGLIFALNNWQQLPSNNISAESSAIVSKLFNHDQALLLEKAELKPLPALPPTPESLTLDDYDRRLSTLQPTALRQGLKLGPALLSAEQFWPDEKEPHLWLKLKLTDFPNLALAHHHSTRILIDKVLDVAEQDRYNRDHSFEHAAFHWVGINSEENETDSYAGIRNVYLKQGTRPEQIRSIIGQLEFNLPLGIKSLQLSRGDVGKTVQIAGKALTLETMNRDGISLRFRGKRSELLSVRAVNQKAEPLPEAGAIWQKIGEAFSLKQKFNGNIDTVTVLVASDSVARRYPFEITR